MKTRILLSHRARRLFLFVHLWLGLVLGVWFSLIGLSGSVLAWRHDLSAWELATRYSLQKPTDGAKMISASQALAAMKAAHPDASPRELAAITITNRRVPFYSFSRGRNRADSKTILIDPYSARVHAPLQMRSLWVGTINQFHTRLVAGMRGYLFNGVLTFLAIPLLLSGLWLWWPKNGAQLKARLTLKRGASLKRRLYDLHNVAGIYLYVVLFVTTLTGAILAASHITEEGIGAYLKGQPREKPENSPDKNRGANANGTNAGGAKRGAGGEKSARLAEPSAAPGAKRLSMDEIVALARGARPGYELTRLQFPLKAGQPVQASYARASGFSTNESASLDPYTGQIRENAEAETRGPVMLLSRALHFGEFGGIFSRLLYSLAGLMPIGLFGTGFLLWWQRKRKGLQTKKLESKSNEPVP